MRMRRVPWTAAWGGCILVACLALDLQEPNCPATQYQQGGICCQKCKPGTKLTVVCSESSETQCEPCEADHFQAGWTEEKYCTPHAYCDENAGLHVYTEGNAKQNVVCRCRMGTHCSSPECLTCRTNRECPVGEGVQREASHLNDTVCLPCPPGSFSNISSATARCQPWRSCKEREMVQVADGSHTSDVVCGVPPTQPPQEEARRTHVLVVVPLVALLGLLGGVLFLFHRRHRQDLWKPNPDQRLEDPLEHERQRPEENECPAPPIQETLLGCQPVTQEDGKESRLAEQEQS